MNETAASSHATSTPRTPIRARSPRFGFASVPRHWWRGNALATHVANGVNLLFPAGERFFVRAVHHYVPQLTDPALREQARGFAAQEGRHARAHEEFFRTLEAQGFRLDGFLRAYEAVAYGFIERVSPRWLALATTAAAEHFTSLLAVHVLESGVLDTADPPVRDLLMWHASEEIEHRAVAFDVLAAVEPGYARRMAGLALASACLSGFWLAAALVLLAQDGDVKLGELGAQRREMRALRPDNGPVTLLARGIREYVRRDFHPLDADVDGLARDYLARAGLTAA